MDNLMPEGLIKNIDIVKGVGELIVHEAKLAVIGLFRGPHQLASHGDHFLHEEEPDGTPT